MGINFSRISFLSKSAPNKAVDNRQPYSSLPNQNLNNDRFESNSPAKYTSEIMIRKLANSNPRIGQILASVNTPFIINMNGLNGVLSKHSADTSKIAEGIVNNLPFSLKQKADLNSIKTAAYLHDIGKVFIPNEILNKTSKLTEKETEIMHKHSELGYELLKNTNLNPKVLHLIKHHHQNAQKSGYPKTDKNFFADLDLQILSMADKYSALTENRPYKPALNREEALTIIRNDVREGKLNPLVYNALVLYTDECALNLAAKINS